MEGLLLRNIPEHAPCPLRPSSTPNNSFLLLRHVQVALQYSHESLFELLIGQSVTKRVYGAVGIAQEVREHEKMFVRAGFVRAEALDKCQNMIWRPASNESTQNERNSSERLSGSVLVPRLLSSHQRVPSSRLGLQTFPNCLHEVLP